VWDVSQTTEMHVAEIAKRFDAEVAKVDSDIGVVFGYAIVCKNGDDAYYDTQGDHITEQAMLEATSAYMQSDRIAKIMHKGEPIGTVLHSFPLTAEIAKSLGLSAAKTGWLIGFKPDSGDVLDKFRTGELSGFSIGGRRITEEVVER